MDIADFQELNHVYYQGHVAMIQSIRGDFYTISFDDNGETRTGVNKNETAYSAISLSGKDGELLDITVTITDPSTGSQIYRSTKTITLGSQDTVTFN